MNWILQKHAATNAEYVDNITKFEVHIYTVELYKTMYKVSTIVKNMDKK